MTNGELHTDWLSTPVGRVQLSFDAAGLHAVTILRGDRSVRRSTADAYPHRDAFERYFAGDIDALQQLPVVMGGTDFQRRVWQALRRIEPGTTLSYAQLASKVGNDRATRAVGSANGRNPLCIVVPCHRVIAADGSLGGFSAGLDVKRWLLAHEGVSVRA